MLGRMPVGPAEQATPFGKVVANLSTLFNYLASCFRRQAKAASMTSASAASGAPIRS
jgi:hypothetical protein